MHSRMTECTSICSKCPRGFHELSVLGFGAKAHDPFNSGAVVPAAVEQGDLLRHREVRHEALEILRATFAIGGRTERNDAGFARAQVAGDPFNHAIFPGCVATLKNHEDLVAAEN